MAEEAPVINPELQSVPPIATPVAEQDQIPAVQETTGEIPVNPVSAIIGCENAPVDQQLDQQPSEEAVPSSSVASDEVPPTAAIVEPIPEEPKVEKPPVRKIIVTIKTPQEKENFEVEEDSGVLDFKKLMAPKFNAEPDQLCLIFAGKIMNDEDNIQQHHVKEGSLIHLVIRAAPRLMENGPQRPPADIRATPFQLGSLGGLAGLAQLGMGSANFMEIQNQMQNELLSNPNTLRNLLDNPLVTQLMAHPETMRTLITRNPQMQELLQR